MTIEFAHICCHCQHWKFVNNAGVCNLRKEPMSYDDTCSYWDVGLADNDRTDAALETIKHNGHTSQARLSGYADGQYSGSRLPCHCWRCVEEYLDCVRDGIAEAIELRIGHKGNDEECIQEGGSNDG